MYDDIVVKKPWGWEEILFENEHLGIWLLNIKHRERTSLHCHPGKRTGLIVLSGVAEVSFMNGSHILKPGQKINIRNGVFHRTEALSQLMLLEVESPNDKENLLRLEDSYGRAGKPYEDSDAYSKEIPRVELKEETVIGDCKLTFLDVNCVEDIASRNKANFVITSGKIYYQHHPVCVPGDVVDRDTFVRLARKFSCEPMKVLEIFSMHL